MPRLQVTTTEDYFRDRARKAGQETPGSDDDDRPLEGCGPQRQQHPGLPMSVGTVIGSDGVLESVHKVGGGGYFGDFTVKAISAGADVKAVFGGFYSGSVASFPQRSNPGSTMSS